MGSSWRTALKGNPQILLFWKILPRVSCTKGLKLLRRHKSFYCFLCDSTSTLTATEAPLQRSVDPELTGSTVLTLCSQILRLETICSRSSRLQFTFKKYDETAATDWVCGHFSFFFLSGLVFLRWTEIRLAPPFHSAAAAGKSFRAEPGTAAPSLPHPRQEGGASSAPLPQWEEKHPHLNIPYPLPESSVSGYIEQGNATSFTALLQDTSRGKKSSGSYPGKDYIRPVFVLRKECRDSREALCLKLQYNFPLPYPFAAVLNPVRPSVCLTCKLNTVV